MTEDSFDFHPPKSTDKRPVMVFYITPTLFRRVNIIASLGKNMMNKNKLNSSQTAILLT